LTGVIFLISSTDLSFSVSVTRHAVHNRRHTKRS
jgi:hypothetical protein